MEVKKNAGESVETMKFWQMDKLAQGWIAS